MKTLIWSLINLLSCTSMLAHCKHVQVAQDSMNFAQGSCIRKWYEIQGNASTDPSLPSLAAHACCAISNAAICSTVHT